jgi:hypothetical protein
LPWEVDRIISKSFLWAQGYLYLLHFLFNTWRSLIDHSHTHNETHKRIPLTWCAFYIYIMCKVDMSFCWTLSDGDRYIYI